MAVRERKTKAGVTYDVATYYLKRLWWEPSGKDKREAQRLDARRKREVKDGTFVPREKKSQPTVLEYATKWGSERVNVSAKDDVRNLKRLTSVPEFGGMQMDDVKPRHIISALKDLKGTVKQKTLLNAYGTLRTMFRDARIHEVISVDPCVLPRNFFAGDEQAEREPYEKPEAAVLISHVEIPEPIRVLNALCLFGGLREGEACGRRWRDLDTNTEPLWALDVANQYGGAALKTKRPRVVPVHPELATILETWARGGFVDLMGKPPTPDDFIVPHASARARGGHHTKSTYYKAFQRACTASGVRARTLHATRHTMITLCQRGGADKSVLERVTHNAKGDIIDRYTHRDWSELCAAVLALGSMFDTPQTPRPNRRFTGENGPNGSGQNTCMLAESHEPHDTGPSSIPGASTQKRAEKSQKKIVCQSSVQSESALLGVTLRSGDESDFAIALAEDGARARVAGVLWGMLPRLPAVAQVALWSRQQRSAIGAAS
jgi:integrase